MQRGCKFLNVCCDVSGALELTLARKSVSFENVSPRAQLLSNKYKG